MDANTLATLSATALVTLLGYLVTYWNSLRLAQRKERLERVDRQLRQFYGPLLSHVSASRAAWKAFRGLYRPGKAFFGTMPPPSAEELIAWRLWMKEVFMPHNEAMARLVTEHADLLQEVEVPQCLLDLCAHVAAYRAVLKAWEAGDFSRHTSVVNFPERDLAAYARQRFDELKARQGELLGHKPKRHAPLASEAAKQNPHGEP